VESMTFMWAECLMPVSLRDNVRRTPHLAMWQVVDSPDNQSNHSKRTPGVLNLVLARTTVLY
jgi:hypothetical protein